MKAILTFSLILFLGGISMAQQASETSNSNTQEVKSISIEKSMDTEKKDILKEVKEPGIVRLYRYKNSRVKSALIFSTKKNKPKLA